jgi:hypothetical protein
MALTYPAGTTPVIPVLQSDTFEIQRQKINNLALASAGPQFIAPQLLVSTTTLFAYTQYVLNSYIPTGSRSAILQIRFGGNSSTPNKLTAKTTSGSTSEYEIASAYAGGGGDNVYSTVQVTIPIDPTTTSFYMKLLNNMTGSQTCIVNLVGYYA